MRGREEGTVRGERGGNSEGGEEGGEEGPVRGERGGNSEGGERREQ